MRLDETNVFHLRRPLDRAAVGKPDIVIVCGGCSRTDSIRAKSNLPPDAVAGMFRNRHWKVDPRGKSALCRSCQMRNKNVIDMPSKAAKKSLGLASRLLAEHFDEEAGTYHDGWSDAAIAEKVGLSEDAVAEWREDSFGPLAVSPEVAKIETDILAVQKKFQTDADEIRELVSAMSKEFGQAIGALRLRLEEATKGRKRAA